MLNMEIAGQKIVYKDLADLRAKLTDLLQTLIQEREAHDRESRRLRREEKYIRTMLGDSAAGNENGAVSGKTNHDA